MAIQYKPTKQKKEKSVKAPKAPKADKSPKMGTATTVKTIKSSKVSKPSKQPKAPKPEKAVSFKSGKVEKAAQYKDSTKSGSGVMTKAVNSKIVIAVLVALVAIIAAVVVFAVPAIEKNGQEIKSIMISRTPDKTVYLIGEDAVYDGLRVTVTRKNGETFNVRADKCQITGFDSSVAAEKQEIVVTYEGFKTSFDIIIKEPPKPTPMLKGISLETLPKTEYKLGEWLDTTGGVILREYVDGSVMRLSLVNSYVFGFADINKPGTYTLTVKYMENGTIAETTYTITVNE